MTAGFACYKSRRSRLFFLRTCRVPRLETIPGATTTLNQSEQEKALLFERPVWNKIDGTWQPLYGGLLDDGVSVEWHDFRVDEPLPWSDSFHPNSLEICLNYTGTAELRYNSKLLKIGNEQIAIYTSRETPPTAIRHANSSHRFVTLEFTIEYLHKTLEGMMDGVIPGIRRFLESPERVDLWMESGPLPSTLLAIRTSMLQPPVSSRARVAWYRSKILEVLAQTVFVADKPEELFCERHKRLNRERIDRVRYLIQRDIENPPSLDMLAEEVDCSPFYLSRLFAEEAGVSLPKYLRLKRVEKAAELIKEGGMSVTDAAMAVGYSSLSAFHKAFVERHGVSPSQYGVKKSRK